VIERIRYFILRAMRNMRQWPFLCMASILTMAVALATVGTFILVVMNIEQLAQRWTQEVQVVAYLKQPVPTQGLAAKLKDLKQIKQVADVRYVSPAEAMQRFKDRLEEDAELLSGVEPDLLPASFELSLHAGDRHQQAVLAVIDQLEKRLQVDDLSYGQNWLERFNSFVGMLRYVGMVLGGLLLLAALFIVSNTIKLTLYARRDELEIMALVGATMRFIKVPFLLEGAIQGLLGGLLSLIFLSLSFYLLVAPGLQALWLTPVDFTLVFLSLQQQAILVAAGVLLGMLGSLSSLRRFVRL
jgi:cell division transport system permease protein